MRVRVPLIIEETIIQEIDLIAGEKHRRAATIELALREFIARHAGKAKPAETRTKVSAPVKR
jgi:metal-responsive CopG/Arc/MetJ family transcriptional regulator